MSENERIWIISPIEGQEYMTRDKEKADKAHAEGGYVESYYQPQDAPDPKAPLHSVSIKATDSSPYSVNILIDDREPQNVQAVRVELGIEHANRCTIVFEPELLEIDGVFEGWVRPGSDTPVRELLERIRDNDEQTSDGSLGSLARQALDLLDGGGPGPHYQGPGGRISPTGTGVENGGGPSDGKA